MKNADKKKENKDFRYQGYKVRHEEVTGGGYILACTHGDGEYAEIVIKKAVAVDNCELLRWGKILFVEAKPAKKKQQTIYTVHYRETERTTVICAESMELYRSGYFIGETGRYAAAEWDRRHICLPSLMTAILMLETNSGKKRMVEIREMIREHTDYLAAYKAEGMQEENWRFLWGQSNYVLAAQYLQNETKPYFADKNAEELLIRTIEENRLTRFDF